MELEAIGDEAVRILKTGLASSDPEVKFYSAEALAYLDCEAAAQPLADAARDEPAFRWHALTALSTMDHVEAYEALTDLLHVPSAETRYGAFRALRTRNPDDPLVRGEALAGDFIYHMIPSNGPPMVHFSMTRRPEVVLFGHNQTMLPPAFLFAGREIMVKGLQNGQMRVSRFQAGQPDEETLTVDANTNAMIRAIAQMGGGYAEVLQAVTEAKNSGYLDSRVVINAAQPGQTAATDGRRMTKLRWMRKSRDFALQTPCPRCFRTGWVLRNAGGVRAPTSTLSRIRRNRTSRTGLS